MKMVDLIDGGVDDPLLQDNICWSIWERPKPENPKQEIKILKNNTDSVPMTIEFSGKYE